MSPISSPRLPRIVSSLPSQLATVVLAIGCLSFLSCSSKEKLEGDAASASGAAAKAHVPSSFALTAEPAGATSVKELIVDARNGDEVVVVGRVGEEVPGLAAFRLVDVSLKPCDEMPVPDACKTPWDYCCTPPDELRKVATTVELRDAAGTIQGDVLGWNGLDHSKTLVVKGRAERDSAGNVTVAATGVFVRK